MIRNSGPPTQADVLSTYEPATAFAEQFLAEHPDLSSGEAARQAYHAAVAAGCGHPLYVEAVVYDRRKREVAEALRARREWCDENRAAFVGGG